MDWEKQILEGERFKFGENWKRFLLLIDENRIKYAEESLKNFLEVNTLSGKRFLDIGCGSGLFSLAARRLGAKVYSFDFDPEAVACTLELKKRYHPNDIDWVVEKGNVLDKDYLLNLGKFDIVYSWGVLHHTGNLWNAMGNLIDLVEDKGLLYIAIYNDQGRASRRWLRIKKLYNKLPLLFRWLLVILLFIRLWGPTMLRDFFAGRPFDTWRNYDKKGRGMSPWRDVIDWIGGLPFEVAKPEEVFDFYRRHNFILKRLKTAGGGHGCNEYVFQKL